MQAFVAPHFPDSLSQYVARRRISSSEKEKINQKSASAWPPVPSQRICTERCEIRGRRGGREHSDLRSVLLAHSSPFWGSLPSEDEHHLLPQGPANHFGRRGGQGRGDLSLLWIKWLGLGEAGGCHFWLPQQHKGQEKANKLERPHQVLVPVPLM